MMQEARISNKRYLTIRQTAAQGILNENLLRCMARDGELPGFYDGYNNRRFLIDVVELGKKLRAASINGGGTLLDEN